MNAIKIDDAIHDMFKDLKIPFFNLEINNKSVDVAFDYIEDRIMKGNL